MYLLFLECWHQQAAARRPPIVHMRGRDGAPRPAFPPPSRGGRGKITGHTAPPRLRPRRAYRLMPAGANTPAYCTQVGTEYIVGGLARLGACIRPLLMDGCTPPGGQDQIPVYCFAFSSFPRFLRPPSRANGRGDAVLEICYVCLGTHALPHPPSLCMCAQTHLNPSICTLLYVQIEIALCMLPTLLRACVHMHACACVHMPACPHACPRLSKG